MARGSRLTGGHTCPHGRATATAFHVPSPRAPHTPPVNMRAGLLRARRRLLPSVQPGLARAVGPGGRSLLCSLWKRQSSPDVLPQTARRAGRRPSALDALERRVRSNGVPPTCLQAAPPGILPRRQPWANAHVPTGFRCHKRPHPLVTVLAGASALLGPQLRPPPPRTPGSEHGTAFWRESL